MKRIFTLLFITISFNVLADTGGPNIYGYTWKDSDEPDGPVYNWIDITQYFNSTQVKLLGDDNSRGPFTMNFDFYYYWYNVNQFWVGSNGYIMFQNGQIAAPFYTFPNTAPPQDVLGICVNDLTFLWDNNPGECWYWINSALDTLIVSWINVPFFNTGYPGYSGTNTFQVILSAVDSSITYQYKHADPFSPYSGSSSVGMENYAGNDGLQWPNNSSIQTPTDETAIKFYYPHPPLQTDVTDAAIIYNDNPATSGTFLVTNGDPITLTTYVRNYSTYTVNPFNVQGKVFDPNGQLVIDDGEYTDTLETTEGQLMTFDTPFSPDMPGTYRFIGNSQLANDPISSGNNSKIMEIVAVDSSQDEMWLGYDDGQTSNYYSLAWLGGQGGAGEYFKPPFYPVVITKLHYFCTSAGAFSGRVFDDDGVLGLPYTLLDSVYVPMSQVVSGNWTTINLADPIVIESGGVFVSWDMQSTSVYLGCLLIQPFAYQSYEVFQNIWGIYRFRETQDPMIAISIAKYSIPTGVAMPDEKSLSLSVFPDPASNEANLLYSINENRSDGVIRITDIQGKIIQQYDLGIKAGTRQMTVDVSQLPQGVYFATLVSGKEHVTKKLVVGR